MARKRAFSLTEQVSLLKSRGLVIEDDAAAEAFLYDTNYYRLAGFARQFQRNPRGGNDAAGDNDFEAGTSLAMLAELCTSDAAFARVLMQALAMIECSVRSRLALHLALGHGETAFYLTAGAYVTSPVLDEKVAAHIAGITEELRRDKGRTVRRYAPDLRDLGAVPIWVAIELLSFGTVSKMLGLLKDRGPSDAVAASFGEPRSTFASTVHSLAVLRNRCAHHGQIWHRRLTIQTPTNGTQRRRAGVTFDHQGPYAAVLAIQRLLTRIHSGAGCLSELNQFIATAPKSYLDGIRHPDPK